MIKFDNLSKIYKTKNNVSINALQNISLSLPKTGMIFLLGKSGSGKSTFLNVLGGLDNFDSGDIFINGKSLKNFSIKELDSYRNTFVGFIFQNYNLLEDFNVKENLELGLNLQRKTPSNQEISNILEKVGLKDFENRKINQLSGGQKQRVAIARALMKNPNIIIADEPSAALDSKTSIQIFNILKELSKERLVLIVSHDRDFAFKYGDRIIELSDGQIFNDISCTENNTIEDNINDINNKKFVKTEYKEDDIYENANLNLIQSNLPLKNAIKIGASAFKNKTSKLIFSIILCSISFVFFIVAYSFACYDKNTALINSYYKSNESFHSVFAYSGDDDTILPFNNEMVDDFKKSCSYDIYNVGISGNNTQISLEKNISNSFFKKVYPTILSYYCEIDENFLNISNCKLVGNSRLPSNNNEIVLTKYIYSLFNKFGYYNNGKIESINSYNDLIGKTLSTKVCEFTICGIIDTNLDFSDINKFSKPTITQEQIDNITQKYDFVKTSQHSCIYVNNNCLENINKLSKNYTYESLTTINNVKINNNLSTTSTYFSTYNKLLKSKFFDSTKLSLNNNECLYDCNQVISYIFNNIEFDYNQQPKDFEQDIIEDNKLFPEIKSLDNIFENLYKIGKYKFTCLNSDYIKELIKSNKNEFATTLTDTEIDNLSINNIFLMFYSYRKEDLTFYNFYLNYIDELISKYNAEKYLFNSDTMKLFNCNYKENELHLLNYNTLIKNTTIENFYINIKKLFTYKNFDLCKDYYSKNISVALSDNNIIDYFVKNLDLIYDETLISAYKDFFIDFVLDYAKINNLTFDCTIIKDNTSINCNVVGFYIDENNTESLLINENDLNNYIDIDKIFNYSFLLIKIPSTKQQIIQQLNNINTFTTNLNIYDTNINISIRLNSFLIENLNKLDSIIEKISIAFLILGLIFAIFASIHYCLYISTSISYKKKDIGILKALGGTGKDIFKIFLAESIIISLIILSLSLIISYIAVNIFNNQIINTIYIPVYLINIGIKQISITILLLSLLTLSATYFSVKKPANKKPIETIKE